MTKKLKLPDFLIIGSGKSGTTSLNNYVKQHPQIFIPDIKEPNFFGYELYSEKDFIGKPILNHYRNSVTNLDSYLNLFEFAEPNQIIGETSNTYLYHEKAPERIYHYIPDAKLIAVLRHPVERLYSRYLHLARENRLPTKDFLDCLDKESIWWSRNDLVNEGFYHKHLSRYYSLFDKSQIKVFLYEEFTNNPMHLLHELFSFLNVDSNFKPNISINYNKSGFIKSKTLNKIVGQKGLLRQALVSVLPDKGYDWLKQNLIVQKVINKIRGSNLNKPRLSSGLKKRITHEIYEEDIIKLSRLLNRDLSGWINN